MRHSIRRVVATAATGGAAAAIVGLSITVPAAATTVVPDGTEQFARVELHTLEPAAPAPGDQVEITGSITNVTDEPLRNVQALLRYDGVPLTDRSDIARVTTEPDVHWGWRPGHIYDIVREELAPGRSAPFDLEFVVDSTCLVAEPEGLPCLGLPADGVYAIGVDANVTTADDERQTGGTARTVVPWQISDADPIPVALLWPVIEAPEIRDGAFDALDDDAEPTAAPDGTPSPSEPPDPSEPPGLDEAPGGTADLGNPNVVDNPPELDPLLATPKNAPVTWAVDPETWSPTVAGAVSRTGELLMLPPSVPDTGALARVDPGLARTVAAEAGRRQQEFISTGAASLPERTDAAWPGAGTVTAEALHAWADAGYDTVVLPRDAVAMPDRSPTASLEVGGERLSAVLTDPGLGSAIADNTRPDDKSVRSAVLDMRQRWLAETALARDEPFRTGAEALVAAPPADWRPSPEVAEAVLDVWTGTEWITPTGISDVTGVAPPRRDTAPAAVLSPLFAGTHGLPDDYVREVRQLYDEITRYRSLLDNSDRNSAASPQADASADPGDAGESATNPPSADAGTVTDTPSPSTDVDPGDPGDATGPTTVAPALTTARATSVAWRGDLDTARAEVAALRREVTNALGGVSVVVNPSNTLSGNTGVFPVNIANELAHAVTVRLEFDPANEDRLAIEPVETRVPGGQQQTVQVRAEAVANGEVPVSVQLATVDGVPLGGERHTIVNATDYGTIGWFVVGGSALLFAGGLSWRMLRGRRRTGQ